MDTTVRLTRDEAATAIRMLAGFDGLLLAGLIEDDWLRGSSAFSEERDGEDVAQRVHGRVEDQALRRDLDRYGPPPG